MNSSTHKSPSPADFVDTGTVDTAATFDLDVLKRFKLKADFILLPILTFAYLLKYIRPFLLYGPPEADYQLIFDPNASSLDRSNMSNAYTAGLSVDLGLTGD